MATETFGKVIAGIKSGSFVTLSKVNPIGSLQVRRQTNGVASLYWRYTLGNYSERVLIGVYDPTAPPKSLMPTRTGYSVQAALFAAQELAIKHYQHRADGGRPALLAAESQALEVAIRQAEEAKAKEDAAKAAIDLYSLKSLLVSYCDYLKQLGRRSHADARSIFRLHVIEPWPELASTPAKEITGEQVADMMRLTYEGGKGRTANKLRSYMRAAYQVARASRTKASIPADFKLFEIKHNPVVDTEPDESHNNADKDPLTLDELRLYWERIKQIDGVKGGALRLHLLTGGQRIEQLVRLKTADVSGDSILLFDAKGRPGKPPRPHQIPLVKLAADALLLCKPKGLYALSSDGGETHISATTLSRWARDAGQEIARFQAKRIRSGVETLLARLKVHREDRGRLQSHGISGVQSRHYDGHDYMPEKRFALEMLVSALECANEPTP